MNGKFGYLNKGKFHLIYASDLMDIDSYTINHYKNRKDLIEKENIPDKSTIVIFCMDSKWRKIYNRSGYSLQSSVLYGKDNLKSLDNIYDNLSSYTRLYPKVTEELNMRFNELEQVSFPRSLQRLSRMLEKDQKYISRYYYVIKQAALAYKKCDDKYKKAEMIPSNYLDIRLKEGNVSINNENMNNYLNECLNRGDQEEFWNYASLDDLDISVKQKQYGKNY